MNCLVYQTLWHQTHICSNACRHHPLLRCQRKYRFTSQEKLLKIPSIQLIVFWSIFICIWITKFYFILRQANTRRQYLEDNFKTMRQYIQTLKYRLGQNVDFIFTACWHQESLVLSKFIYKHLFTLLRQLSYQCVIKEIVRIDVILFIDRHNEDGRK